MIKREHYLDFIGGIMILWMIVYAHFTVVTKYELPFREQLTYGLHLFMPWFFYKAGMFHKKTSFEEVLKKSFSRLLVPYIIFTLIALVFDSIKICLNDGFSIYAIFLKPIIQIVLLGTTSANGPLWFLISLFIVRVLAVLIEHQPNKIQIISFIIFLTVPFIFYYFNFKKFIYIPNSLNGFIFYWIGYKLKEAQFSNKIFIISSIFYFIIAIIAPAFGDIRKNIMYEGNYFVWYIFCTCGIITINNIIKRLKIRDYVLTTIGKDSMTYYVTHWIFLTIAHILTINILHINNNAIYFWTAMGLCFVICPIINYYLPKSKYSFILGIK